MDLSDMDGLFVGQIGMADLSTFDKAVDHGMAQRTYEGLPGHLGLATVRLTLFGWRVVEQCKGVCCLAASPHVRHTAAKQCACYEWAIEREAASAAAIRSVLQAEEGKGQ